MAKSNRKFVTDNRKARFNYHIEDKFETGMVLQGTEVKALRMGRAHLKDAYARIQNGEIFVHQMHIGPYPFAYYENHDPLRTRKLLMHHYEIKQLTGKVQEKGYSLIPLNIYFRDGKAKMTLALAKGKRLPDKRHAIRERDEKRDMDRMRKDGVL